MDVSLTYHHCDPLQESSPQATQRTTAGHRSSQRDVRTPDRRPLRYSHGSTSSDSYTRRPYVREEEPTPTGLPKHPPADYPRSYWAQSSLSTITDAAPSLTAGNIASDPFSPATASPSKPGGVLPVITRLGHTFSEAQRSFQTLCIEVDNMSIKEFDSRWSQLADDLSDKLAAYFLMAAAASRHQNIAIQTLNHLRDAASTTQDKSDKRPKWGNTEIATPDMKEDQGKCEEENGESEAGSSESDDETEVYYNSLEGYDDKPENHGGSDEFEDERDGFYHKTFECYHGLDMQQNEDESIFF